MPSWLHPDNASVTGECGDRLLMLVHERNRKGQIDPRIVTIAATEDGWDSDDPLYQGYGPGDSVLCIWEKDFCRELAENEVAKLEASMTRMDQADPDEIDSEFYEEVLGRAVKLRGDRS